MLDELHGILTPEQHLHYRRQGCADARGVWIAIQKSRERVEQFGEALRCDLCEGAAERLTRARFPPPEK